MPTRDVSSMIDVVDVAFDSRTSGIEATFTYLAPFALSVGDAVLAPLGNRTVLGFVRRVFKRTSADLDTPLEKLKPVVERIEGLSLPEHLLDLVEYAAREYLCPFSVALTAAMPPSASESLLESWHAIERSLENVELSAFQRAFYEGLLSSGPIVQQGRKKVDASTAKALRQLATKGLASRSTTFSVPQESKAAQILYRPIADGAKIEEFLKANSRKKPAQALVLLKLREIEEAALTASDIKGLCGVTDTTVKQLIASGLIEPVGAEGAAIAAAPIPNAAQQLAISAIVESVSRQTPDSFLLFGVTGSGKTEVYLKAAAEAIKMGRQVLYLTPEIALATQAVKLLRERFGRSVAILHSDLPPRERSANWAAIRKGEAAVVLGARSALFAPLTNLGLIVVDEEHEASYKQDSAPRYHAKRLALFLGRRHRCPVVLGSATPSFETFFEADHGSHTMLTLPDRTASAKLPVVHVVDLGEGFRQSKPAIFAEPLQTRLQSTLDRGEQAILFLNRRAYAPFLICRDCGQQFVCPNCSVSLAWSRRTGKLRCHHCGHNEQPPTLCPQCGGSRIKPFGIGAERVEEEVALLFPSAVVARLDRDIAQKKGALESILAAFGAGDIDVLVGTQMVAKGLNFPGVTLVGAIAADMSLNLPDFRAAERTFQLLSQVAGRAGRGEKPGEVVIQTFNPSHVSILATQTHNFVEAYEALIEERKEAGFPPFSRLVNVLFTGVDQPLVSRVARAWAASFRDGCAEVVSVLGPTDCAIERLNKNWRVHALIKVPSTYDLSSVQDSIDRAREPGVQIIADVDAYSMI